MAKKKTKRERKPRATDLERYADMCAARALGKQGRRISDEQRTKAREAAKDQTTGPAIRKAVESAFGVERPKRKPARTETDTNDPPTSEND